MSRLGSVLVWSVIAAAFIGPGTVTTAASAGAGFGYRLLWALTFSTIATLVLQEAAARMAAISGRDLGQALRERYPRGLAGLLVLLLVLGAVVLGCAAYEAGNILGGVAGAALVLPLDPRLLAAISVAAAAALLWFQPPRRVALAMSLLVALMGMAFLAGAALLVSNVGTLLAGALTPSLPPGGALLALGLVGTTVVPYNLFLGSGLARGQRVAEIRLGLAVAVVLGGVISMGVLVVGAAVPGEFSFEALSAVLASRLGPWAGTLFSLGLFAAGLSSAVTAPLAAAMTARGLFAEPSHLEPGGRWNDRGVAYRAIWIGVLAVGLGFGVSGVRPVPVIVLAQAFNGLMLPVAALFLLVAINDRRLMGDRGVNGIAANTALAAVTAITVLLGASSLARAGAAALGYEAPAAGRLVAVALVALAAVAWPVVRAARAGRRLPLAVRRPSVR